jgi:6-phosphogluconolactonase (cycloisomerase 2 family)
MTGSSMARFLVGSYTPSSGGNADGITLVERTERSWTSSTLAILDDPSFLAVDGNRVYAVSETEDGGVHAFAWDGHGLEPLWTSASGGDAPCHVRIDPAGLLVVTNYTSGTVSAVRLDGDDLAVEVLPDVEGPVPERQEGPHAHQSLGTPAGTVLVSDLGGDAIHEFRITPGSAAPTIEQVRVHRVAPGAGPRHMAWAGDDLLVAGELDGHLHRLRADDDGLLRDVDSAPATDTEASEGMLSHLEVDEERGLAYVAVRGSSTIAVFDIREGRLERVAEVPSGGTWPRHFARTADALLVANQLSDGVAVLPLDAAGIPGPASEVVPIGSPTCVVPLP